MDDVIQGEGKKGEGKGTEAKKPDRSYSNTTPSPPTAMEYHLVSERRQTIRAFLKNMPTRSCDCCQAAAVSYKKNRDSKIFRRVAAGKKKGGGDDGNMQYVTPLEVLTHFQYLWQNEEEIVNIIWTSALSPPVVMKETQNEGYRIFFLFVLPIPPNKFRPANKVCAKYIMLSFFVSSLWISQVNGMLTDHAQNFYYTKVLQLSRQLLGMADKKGDEKTKSVENDEKEKKGRGAAGRDRAEVLGLDLKNTESEKVSKLFNYFPRYLTLDLVWEEAGGMTKICDSFYWLFFRFNFSL